MGIELLFLARTQPLSPRVHYEKNQIERVYTKGDIIHDRSRSTGFRIFSLACNHTMDRIAFCRKVYFGLFFQSCIFEDILREVVVSLSKAVGKYLLR